MAAPNAPCRLLQLPRELRNNIYEELNHDHFITITRDHDPNSKRRNGMAVDNAPYASVMRLCKQIHYEYDDVRFKKVHLIIYTAEMRLKLSTFDLKAGVPKELFKHVTWCQVSIPYGLLIDCDEDIVEEFNDAVAAGETMDETYRRAWTPSIDAVEKLSGMMKQLSKWIPEKQATIGLDIFVRNAIEDFEFWVEQRLIQSPIFNGLKWDEDTPFAREEKLDVRFSLIAPLASTIEEWDMKGLTEDDFDDDSLQFAVDGTVYKTTDSKDKVKWFLLPTCRCHADDGWCGFVTRFAGIMPKCCHHN